MNAPAFGFLRGYRTYVLAGLGLLMTWVAFALGEPVNGTAAPAEFSEVMENTLTFLIVMTMRAAIASKNADAADQTVPVHHNPEAKAPEDLQEKMESFIKEERL